MTLLNKLPLEKRSSVTPSLKPNYLFWGWLVFLILGLLGTINHAMWRDELNGWLIARDSESLGQFFYNIRYEGHPIVWYSFLALLNQLTHNPVIMQLFHWLIATISVSLFILFSPFSKLQKTLFIFGYLPFYEYQVISRNYAIGMLSIFVVCCLWKTRKKTYLWLALALAFMANTNAYCLLISLSFFITLLLDGLVYHRKPFAHHKYLLSLLIYLGGVVTSVMMLFPPADSTLQGGSSQWFFQFDFYRLFQTLSRIWNSYILILVPSDSQILDVGLFSILSLGLMLFVVTLLKEKPIALAFYLTGSVTILLFTYLKFLGSPRHYGHLYLILIATLWLASYYPKWKLNILDFKPVNIYLKRWQSFVKKRRKAFILLLLICQIIAGIVAFSRDLTIPYSASRETASFIKHHYLKHQKLNEMFMVGSEDFTLAPIAGYLNRKIYYPESQTIGSYVLFNHQRKSVNDTEILEELQTILKNPNESLLLILNHELTASHDHLKISPIKQFTNGFIYNEKYYLYEVMLS